MDHTVAVENIKCGGCANSIRNKLLENSAVKAVEVDIPGGRVTVETDTLSRAWIVTILAHIGYPEAGSVEGLKAATAKAKSFVSCAIGRIDIATGKGD